MVGSNLFCIHIYDGDVSCLVLDIFLTEDNYQAMESDGFLKISVCRNNEIPLFSEIKAMISAVTVENATSSGRPLQNLSIPADNPHSPNRASQSVDICTILVDNQHTICKICIYVCMVCSHYYRS